MNFLKNHKWLSIVAIILGIIKVIAQYSDPKLDQLDSLASIGFIIMISYSIIVYIYITYKEKRNKNRGDTWIQK